MTNSIASHLVLVCLKTMRTTFYSYLQLRGKQAKETFIQERLEKGEDFFEPNKRMNLKTMEDMGKNVKVKTANNKIV